jgi:hypothetical protein
MCSTTETCGSVCCRLLGSEESRQSPALQGVTQGVICCVFKESWHTEQKGCKERYRITGPKQPSPAPPAIDRILQFSLSLVLLLEIITCRVVPKLPEDCATRTHAVRE